MKRGKLKTEVKDERIVVTLEGSSLRALFYLTADGKLLQSEVMAIDHEVPKDQRRDFEQVAWEAACTKARDLGWI